MSRIRPDELDARLGTADAPFVLDIRPESNYASGAIDGSENVPVYGDLSRGDESSLRSALGSIPSDAEIVVVCKMGIVAKRATRVLTEQGYDAVTLAGGMSGWNGYQRDSIGYTLRSLWWRLR